MALVRERISRKLKLCFATVNEAIAERHSVIVRLATLRIYDLFATLLSSCCRLLSCELPLRLFQCIHRYRSGCDSNFANISFSDSTIDWSTAACTNC